MALITGNALIRALADLGVVPPAERVRRVVVDARAGHATVIHVELIGDERLLEVVPTLEGVDIRPTELAPASGTFHVRTDYRNLSVGLVPADATEGSRE